ncbi:hypothetical protein SAOR_15975 [Salinisphaera orenii MK-B5]|uniref:TonB-dependent receptor plug domain-containing protein n=1 Tax=Salinisphaera orenii MK-B5 TaxID=856730 RepID=A0A423PFD6_9GAMM|nr:TonB-dependent receptor [Salinisphaera orenii]ROO24317.1 hypothetical protein SAOR_15975 [Salinisphaera orenii MK-B5]
MFHRPERALSRALLLSACGPVLAAGVDTPSPDALGGIEVEGSAIEETLPAELAAYGAEREVIEGRTLEETGMSDVAQALERLVPGLFVAPRAGRGSYIDASLDGSRTQDVLWLVDGVRINNRLYGSTTPLDSITTQMIDHIEVLRGGQGLFYGTQAVAGVVNIVLRKPKAERGGELRLGTGTLGDRRAAGHVTGPGPLGEWLVFGAYDESDGYEPFERDAYQANARRQDRGFKRQSIGAKYSASPMADSSLRVLALYNDAAADNAKPVNNYHSLNDRDEVIASIKWDQRLSDRFSYYAKGYWHSWWTDYTRIGLDDDGSRHVINDGDEWGYDDYGANLAGRYIAPGGSQLLLGYDFQSYSGRDYVLRIDEQAETVHAGFAQFRPVLAFSPDTRIALGARYNHSDFGGEHTIWNASLDQPLAEGLRLKASAGTHFILPSAYQLFVIDPAFPAGNPDLGPEESRNVRAALVGDPRPGVHWKLGGFHREIDHLITVEEGTFRNADEGVRVRGAQGALELGGATGWQFDISATYADSQTLDGDGQIPGIPEWVAKSSLAWDSDRRMRGARLSVRHVGENTEQLADYGDQSFGDYTLFDASAYQRFGDDGAHRVTLRLENLTDRRYATRVAQDTRADGDTFRYDWLGVPRNAQLIYSYTF